MMTKAESLRFMACRIVERDAHVSWSTRRCAYYVIKRLRKGRRTYWAQPRNVRRALWLGAYDGNKSNLQLYAMAMGPSR